jgi:DNA-binding PadR family transcriptional regulator
MEDAGLIDSQWEKAEVAQREQRPARKYYELTKVGQAALAEAAARYRMATPAPARAAKPSPARR